MKSFLEEYGFAILAAIVVILLIAMATPVGDVVKKQVFNVVENLGTGATGKLTSLESGDAISLSVKQATNENKFLYVAQSDSSSDTFKLQVRVKNSGGWTNFTDVTGKSAITGDGVQKELIVGTDIHCENGNQVEFQMTDNATGKIYSSAALTFTAYEGGGSSTPTAGEETNPQVEYLSLGGKVFLDNGDNGATYKFYDASKNEITYTDLSSLDNAVYYEVEGTPTQDRFYVVAADSNQSDYISDYGVNFGESKYWGYYEIETGETTYTIGSGKTNTATILAIEDTSEYYEGSIWEWLNNVNTNKYGGCDDWFIGSQDEYDALNLSAKAELLFDSNNLWCSFEHSDYSAGHWYWPVQGWDSGDKNFNFLSVVAFRAF